MARQHSIRRCILLGVLPLLIGAPPVTAAPQQLTNRIVTIQAFKYLPSPLLIQSGEAVVWRNRDLVPHTVTSTSGQFESGEIKPGADWTFRPMKKGKFPYVCQYHPGMEGTLVVR